MQRIEAVIRREDFDRVKKALERVSCPGMMVIPIRGHGRQGGITEYYRGHKLKVDLVPKVLLVIVVNDDQADAILKAIQDTAHSDRVGDGKIFVSELKQAIRIRTGENGKEAV